MTGTLFDAAAESYDQWCTTPLGALTAGYEQAALHALLPPQLTGVNVLDVGCGTGTWALALAARGAAVTGIDISPEMVRVARRKAAVSGHSVTFMPGDGRCLPFPAANFDLVTALLVLEFALDPSAVLSEMVRVLRPGGTLLVAALNRHSIWTVLRRLKGLRRPTLYHHARFLKAGQLEAMLRSAGVAPVARRAAVFYPPLAAAWARPLLRALEAMGQRGLGLGPAFLAIRAVKPELRQDWPQWISQETGPR